MRPSALPFSAIFIRNVANVRETWPDILRNVILAKCPLLGHFDACRMANLTCFSIAGMKLWFYSNDHTPPHFHANKKTPMSKADKRLLQEMVEEHRFELLREWEEKVNRS